MNSIQIKTNVEYIKKAYNERRTYVLRGELPNPLGRMSKRLMNYVIGISGNRIYLR